MDMKKLINRYRHNPVLFVEEVLKAKPEPEQRQMLTALNENRMIAIKAGHGVGKTTTLAWSILWFLFTRLFCKSTNLAFCNKPSLRFFPFPLFQLNTFFRNFLIKNVRETEYFRLRHHFPTLRLN